MSEFRKYRLVSKLLDSYGVVAAPQKYVATLSRVGNLEKEDRVDISSVMKHCQDQPRAMEAIEKLTAQSSEDAVRLLSFIVQLLGSEYREVPMQPIRDEIPIEKATTDQFGSRIPHLQELLPHINTVPAPKELDGELDKLANNLSRTYHRLGAFDPLEKSVEKMRNLNIGIHPFKNDFEWSAGKFPLPLQELFVVEDLLSLLLGISGRYICRADSEACDFLVDNTLSKTILNSALPILRAGFSFRYLENFTRARCSYLEGRICQAFASRLEQLLQEFRQVVVLLERKFFAASLGLQQLQFHIQPYERNLEVLAEVVHAIENENLRGGAILLELERVMTRHAGDRVVSALLNEITVGCAVPLLSMFTLWVTEGRLDDYADEFFIRPQDKQKVFSADEKSLLAVLSNFFIVESNMPSTFKSCSKKILYTGSYHNVLRHYSQDPENYTLCADQTLQNSLSYDQRRIHAFIEQCFLEVNRKMMTELTAGGRLLAALRICKRYYFVENCDLLHAFLDFNRRELDKPASAVIIENLKLGWENSQRIVCNYLDDKDLVECYLTECSLSEQLQQIIVSSEVTREKYDRVSHTRGIDLFSIRVKFEFPHSLLFNSENLAKYELIFRFMFRLVDTSRQLATPLSIPGSASKSLVKGTTILCRQMLHLMQNLHQYLSYEVFEPTWEAFLATIPSATGIDAIIALHVKFIDDCLRKAMLTNAKLVQLLAVLFTQCQRFLALVDAGLESSDTQSKLSTVNSAFNKSMRMFLEALQYYSSRDYDYHLGTLFSRLDYNSFYYSTSFGADFADGPLSQGDQRTTFSFNNTTNY